MRIKKDLTEKLYVLLFQFMLTGVLFLLISGMLSCNNKPSGTVAPDSDSLLKVSDETYIMKLDSSVLAKIFNSGQASGHEIKELHFEWQTKKKYFLRVYGTAEKNTYPTDYYDLEVIDTIPAVKNIKKLTRNPQSITRGELKSLFGIAPGTITPIPTSQLKTIYFKAGLDEHPQSIGKKYLYLFYSTDLNMLNASFSGAGFTNPSPPKPPCDLDCDSKQ